jgi:hypothetical protein
MLHVENLSDADRFRSVVRDAYRRLTARPHRLDTLLRSPTFKADLREALLRTYDGGQRTEILIAAALHPRHHVDAVLGMAHTLFEGPGKRHTAALLSVVGTRPYDLLRDLDAGVLHAQAVQAGLAPLLVGLDRETRGAQAHLMWTLDGDDVLLKNRGQLQRVPIAVLVDQVLTAQESIFALTFVVNCAAAAHGVEDLFDGGLAQDLGLSETAYIGMIARCFGIDDVVVQEQDGPPVTWSVTGHVDAPPSLMGVAIAILASLPARAEFLVLTVDTSAGTTSVSGPTECWRRWREVSDPTEREHALYEACTLWTQDGLPVADRAQVRKWMSFRALEAVQTGYPAAVAPLRALQALARRIDDPHLAAAVKQCIGWVRRAAIKQEQPAAALDAIDQLTTWGSADVEAPRIG